MTNEIFCVSGSVSASQPGQMLFQLVLRHNATLGDCGICVANHAF